MDKTLTALKLAEEALDLAQALLEKSCHHATILNAYKETRKYREALAEQEKQEPVAWMVIGDGQHGVYKAGEHFDSIECSSYWNNRGYELVPVYAAPVSAKREWVDLTDREAEAAFDRGGNELCLKLRAVIAAYKEKNRA